MVDARNKRGETPFLIAVKADRVEADSYLLQSRADKDMRVKDVRTKLSLPPLLVAVDAGLVEAVKCVLRVGADEAKLDENPRSRGPTSLF